MHEDTTNHPYRYSSILRTAIDYTTARDFPRAQQYLELCSDRRKVPENLREIVARSQYANAIVPKTNSEGRGTTDQEEQDVMGETMYTFKHPRPIIPNEKDQQEQDGENPDGSGQNNIGNKSSIYDPYCVNKIGEFLLTGMVFEKNFTSAIHHFVEAANVGNEDAQYNLGVLFANILEEDPHYDILQKIV